jgi:hypothetical protein
MELQSRDLELPVDNAVSDTFEEWLQGEDWSNPSSIQWVGPPSGTFVCFLLTVRTSLTIGYLG